MKHQSKVKVKNLSKAVIVLRHRDGDPKKMIQLMPNGREEDSHVWNSEKAYEPYSQVVANLKASQKVSFELLPQVEDGPLENSDENENSDDAIVESNDSDNESEDSDDSSDDDSSDEESEPVKKKVSKKKVAKKKTRRNKKKRRQS